MEAEEARERVGSARVATLATTDPAGAARLVPITFALVGPDTLVTAVDHKPKRTTALARLADIEARPAVSVLVDHYDDQDWSALWWVRLHGQARVVQEGAEHAVAVDALVRRYAQYVEHRPAGAVIWITIDRWQGWSGSG